MKKVLFVSASLGLGGSEKCMAEMIRGMDPEKYEITLLALIGVENRHGFDPRIRVINGLEQMEYINQPMRKFIPQALKRLKFGQLWHKLRYWIAVKQNKHHNSQELWQELGRYLPEVTQRYDAVIGYGQGLATCFAMEKVVNAKKKILWLNTDLEQARYNISYFRRFYEGADCVVADSQNGVNNLRRLYPAQQQVYCFPNMMDVQSILDKAQAETVAFSGKRPHILSVGRLCEAKAFHLAVDAAGILKKQGIAFTWHIIGDGSLRQSLQEQICRQGLEDTVVLEGLKANPYPYFMACDIYVQTSVYEGSCMTLNEAMVFCKPLVTTNFPAALEKVQHGVNGLTCAMEGSAIAQQIAVLLQENTVAESISRYLQEHPISYGEQMRLLDVLLESEEKV